jgi:APA family basic amino acid/polyamine antiporter
VTAIGSPAPVQLERALGPLDAAAVVVSSSIGAGILATPGLVAALVPAPAGRLTVWALGGVLALLGALAYAELAARMPKAGGEYVYLREAFGPTVAFLSGWTSLVAGFSGAIAAGAVACAAAALHLVTAAPGLGGAPGAPAGQAPPIGAQTAVALAIVVVLSLVHVRGIRPGRKVQNALTIGKIAVLLGVIALGFVAPALSAIPAPDGLAATTPAMGTALIVVLFAYSGWNAATYLAEEVREPVRNVPRGLVIGTTVVVLLYLMVNLALMRGLGSGLTGSPAPTADLAGRVLGPAGGSVVAAATCVILLGSLSAMVQTGPRVTFAMARDGLAPRAAARLHPLYRTPHAAIAAQAVWSGILVLSGSFEWLVAYTGMAVVIFAALAVGATLVMRRRDQGTSARRRYPLGSIVFVTASAWAVGHALLERPGPTLAGLGIVVAGLPVCWMFSRRPRLARDVKEGSANGDGLRAGGPLTSPERA